MDTDPLDEWGNPCSPAYSQRLVDVSSQANPPSMPRELAQTLADTLEEDRKMREHWPSILDAAKQLVDHDRQAQYGDPVAASTAIGSIMLDLICHGGPLAPGEEHAIHMIVTKLVRRMNGADASEVYTDIAGYAEIGHRCVLNATEGNTHD